MFRALVARSIGRSRGILMGGGGLLICFQVALVLEARAYDPETFETLRRMIPGYVQRWLGESMAMLGSFAGVVSFGYFHPMIVLMVSMMTAYLASDPASDVENGHVDLLLSRPIARHWLVTRSLALIASCPIALAGLMMTATWTALALFAPRSAPWPSLAVISLLAAHLVAVAWCFGSLSLLFATMVRRRSAAFAPTALAAVGLYLVNVLAASWPPAKLADLFSPFHYYQGTKVLAGLTNPARDLTVLSVAASLLIALSFWRFSARDL